MGSACPAAAQPTGRILHACQVTKSNKDRREATEEELKPLPSEGGSNASLPDSVWHLNVFMPINLASQFEFTVKTQGGEEALQETVQQALVKLIIDAAPINGLSHQSLQSRPRDLIGRDILTTLHRETTL